MLGFTLQMLDEDISISPERYHFLISLFLWLPSWGTKPMLLLYLHNSMQLNEFCLYCLKRRFLLLVSFIPGDGSKGPLLFQHMIWSTESSQTPTPHLEDRTPFYHSRSFLAAHYDIHHEMEKQHGLDCRVFFFLFILNK